jgi:hypothetical protein
MTLKAMSFDASSVSALAKAFKTYPLILQPGVDFVLSDQAYVRNDFPMLLTAPAGPVASSLPATALSQGFVTFDTAKTGPVTVNSLASLKWSKPFTVNYLLAHLALSVTVKNLPEVKFLDMVRKAVGGLWIDRNGSRVLVPDPSQIRSRVLETFVASEPTQDKIVLAKRNLFVTTVQNFGDVELATLFDNPHGNASGTVVPNGPVSMAALNMLQTEVQEESKRTLGRSRSISTILSQVDSTRPVTIKLTANGTIQLQIPQFNARTKRRSVVTLN